MAQTRREAFEKWQQALLDAKAYAEARCYGCAAQAKAEARKYRAIFLAKPAKEA